MWPQVWVVAMRKACWYGRREGSKARQRGPGEVPVPHDQSFTETTVIERRRRGGPAYLGEVRLIKGGEVRLIRVGPIINVFRVSARCIFFHMENVKNTDSHGNGH